MTKLISVTARLEEESLKYVHKVSKLFQLDKSTAFRRLLMRGIQEDKKERALELYRLGKYSIESAAKFAGLYIGEFLELMDQKGIESNVTMEDYQESLKHAERLRKK